mmetsp:Transcript_13818/g.46699  ORF Transcript_13818/g.46699 Transcript_13818/m.46699 type:complete len:228 (-) Transcript_13818:210-893(-)
MFERVRAAIPVHILPGALQDTDAALRAKLNTSLLKYVPLLEGVPLAVEEVKVCGSIGYIREDTPDIHLLVEVTVLLFKPETGTVLEGIVTRVSNDLTSVLVLGVFTATIRADGRPSSGSSAGHSAGDRVRFIVTGVHVSNDILSIDGGKLRVLQADNHSASASKSRSKSKGGTKRQKSPASASPAGPGGTDGDTPGPREPTGGERLEISAKKAHKEQPAKKKPKTAA